jgi:hypothetical protein
MCNVDSDRKCNAHVSGASARTNVRAVPRRIVGCVAAGRSDWARPAVRGYVLSI